MFQTTNQLLIVVSNVLQPFNCPLTTSARPRLGSARASGDVAGSDHYACHSRRCWADVDLRQLGTGNQSICGHMVVSANRGTPSHHPFLDGIFPTKNHPFRGTPMTSGKAPYHCYSWERLGDESWPGNGSSVYHHGYTMGRSCNWYPGGFVNMRGNPNGWMVFVRENPYLEMDDDWGYPHVRKPPYMDR